VSIEHQVVPEMDPDLLSSDVAFYLEDLVAEPSPGEKVNEFFDPDQELMDIGATAMSEVELVPVFGEGGRVIGLRPDVSDVDGELALIVARSEARTHSATDFAATTAMSEVELVPVFGEGGRVIGLRPDVSDVDGELALIVARSEARTHSATAPRVLSGPTAFTFRV
jgi:hypothetical protein